MTKIAEIEAKIAENASDAEQVKNNDSTHAVHPVDKG